MDGEASLAVASKVEAEERGVISDETESIVHLQRKKIMLLCDVVLFCKML